MDGSAARWYEMKSIKDVTLLRVEYGQTLAVMLLRALRPDVGGWVTLSP